MTDRAMERRVCAVEKRLGVTGRPLEHLSDLDLLRAIEAVSEFLAASGNADPAEMLAQHDAEEATLRVHRGGLGVAGSASQALEPGVRWPYLCGRARWHEDTYGRKGPRSAANEAELWRKIIQSGCLESARC